MSVFHKWNIVFVQIPKNASSSIYNRLENKSDENISGNHSTYLEDMQSQDPELFESYFSFAVIRNPYDRLVSAFEFASMDENFNQEGLNFENFVKKCDDVGPNFYVNQPIYFTPQYKFITIKNILLVDKIIHYENINDEWSELVEKLNTMHNFAPIKSSLDIINPTPYKQNKNWEDYYNPDLKNIVYNLYKKDFEIFKYEK